MATEALQGGPYPAGTAAANVPADVQAVVVWAAPKLVQTYASAAARTSAFSTAAVSPAQGMLCYRSDAPGLNKFETYDPTSGQWRVADCYRDANTLTTTAASVTFSNVPVYLKTLRITIMGRGDTNAGFAQLQLRLGGDSGALYGTVFHSIQNGGATGGGTTTATNATAGVCGYIPAATATSGRFGANTLTIEGWDNPAGHTTGCQWAFQGGYLAAAAWITSQGVGEYVGTAALTSVTILPSAGSFVAGSQFTLLGNA